MQLERVDYGRTHDQMTERSLG